MSNQTTDRLLVTHSAGSAGPDYAAIDLATGESEPIPTLEASASLQDYSPSTREAVFLNNRESGTSIVRSSIGSTTAKEVVTINASIDEIKRGTFRRLPYTSLDGEQLQAWLLLPPDYVPGKRYPVITQIYPGDTYGMRPPGGQTSIAGSYGYAILFPSIPLKTRGDGVADDPLLRISNGVMPAVDAAVGAGLVDERRVFLTGHSFGGFGTTGLIGQTNRFRAAVAENGITDLVSQYYSTDSRSRYLPDHPQTSLYYMSYFESAQGRMGGPPWRDLWRYIRNSPIHYTERVQTPVLLIHSDLDGVPLAQFEAFFQSLFRQGKRAQLVRYFGEDHVFRSPANIRDKWERTLAWFDEFGDILRDAHGTMLFDGERASSRGGAPPLSPAAFRVFERNQQQ